MKIRLCLVWVLFIAIVHGDDGSVANSDAEGLCSISVDKQICSPQSWYYNAADTECVKYSDCAGLVKGFDSEQDCISKCRPNEDEAHVRQKRRARRRNRYRKKKRQPKRIGWLFGRKKCKPRCLGNTVCRKGKCRCRTRFTWNKKLKRCIRQCKRKCGRNSECKRGRCVCKNGFRIGKGRGYTIRCVAAPVVCKPSCGRKEVCQKGKCKCKAGFWRTKIGRCKEQCKPRCLGNTVCRKGKCRCRKRFTWNKKLKRCILQCKRKCGRNSECKRGRCVCKKGFRIGKGRGYTIRCVAAPVVCKPSCGRKEVCQKGKCKCKAGFWRTKIGRCKEKCKPRCLGNTVCRKGKCRCRKRFTWNKKLKRCILQCKPKCGRNSECKRGRCVCKKGFMIGKGRGYTIRCDDETPCSDQKYNIYRTYDGFCNNLKHPFWGMSKTAQRRFEDKKGKMIAYEDGVSLPRGGIKPTSLPSPRYVTNKINDESLGPDLDDQLDNLRSGQIFGHGQALAHDVVDTQLEDGIDCCDPKAPESKDEDSCFPFYIPLDDRHFPPGSCKNFTRAVRAAKTEDSLHREQVNLATSYCDASFLYGSTTKRAYIVREKDTFLLKTDDGSLPTHPSKFADFCFQKPGHEARCPFAGDPRVSEISTLSLNHLVWIKEHNRIAQVLHNLNPGWNDERVFQEARRIIIAMWQHITYNAYLPKIIDRKAMRTYGLFSTPIGFRDRYDDDIDGSTRNAFAVAPMRVGHTQIKKSQSLLKADYTTLTENKVENIFFCPHIVKENQEDLARWLTYTEAMKFDNFVVESLRSKLFSNFEPADDLISRNIQRARDQGVPDYNRWRAFCGLKKIKSFREFGKFGDQLEELYKDVDNVDLFVGGLLEKGKLGATGETFSCLIGKQFQILKRGDRFWYERGGEDFSFSKAQLNSIKWGAWLSRIFCRHFNLKKIQPDIFTPGKNSRLLDCDRIPEVDLSLWKE